VNAMTYQLTVAGHLDDHWTDWLGGQTLTRNDDASTTFVVEAVDQAQLHGVLARIRDLGVTLLALNALDEVHPVRDASHPKPGGAES
jgi:hypothetical protein